MTSCRRLLILLLGLLGTAGTVRSQRQLSGARRSSDQLGSAGAPVTGTSHEPTSQQLRVANPVTFSCPASDGYFAHPSRCNEYFKCKHNIPKKLRCPEGLLFHPERLYPCVYRQETNCTHETPQPDGQQLKSLQRNGETCDKQFGAFLVNATDCGAYVICNNYHRDKKKCPEGLAFDINKLFCTFPDKVDSCNATDYLNFECPQREFTPNEIDGYTLEQNPDNCTKYFICINKEDNTVAPRLQTCPDNKIFNPADRSCVDPELVTVTGCDKDISMRFKATPPVADAAEELNEEQQKREAEKERRASRVAELRFKLQG